MASRRSVQVWLRIGTVSLRHCGRHRAPPPEKPYLRHRAMGEHGNIRQKNIYTYIYIKTSTYVVVVVVVVDEVSVVVGVVTGVVVGVVLIHPATLPANDLPSSMPGQ